MLDTVVAGKNLCETEATVVGMGEVQVTNSPEAVLSCIGLGSCVAVCVYDHIQKVGGLGHIVLPKSNQATANNHAKFADTAVPLLLKKVLKYGGTKKQLVVKIAGGAQMSLAPGLNNTFKTGERNVEEIIAALKTAGINLDASDVGGHKGRTVRMYIDTGKVTVKTVGGDAREL